MHRFTSGSGNDDSEYPFGESGISEPDGSEQRMASMFSLAPPGSGSGRYYTHASGSGSYPPFSTAPQGSGSGVYPAFAMPPQGSGSAVYPSYAMPPPGFGAGVYPSYLMPPPGSRYGGYSSYTVPPGGGSSAVLSPSLGMAGLNVTSDQGWPHMQAGVEGSSRGSPLFHVPSSSEGLPTAAGQQEGQPSSRATNPAAPKVDRARWSKEDTKIFCEIYCTQIDLGNCKNGNMTKWGWIDVQDRFRQQTGKLHSSEQFGHKLRLLKQLWLFIEQLRHKFTGLGRRDDGSVKASDQWWEDHCKGKQDWLELKDGWPAYIDELDRMFGGVAVTGSSSFVPGVSRRLQYGCNGEDDEQLEGQAGDHTPVRSETPVTSATPATYGSGSKRSSSTRSTCGTPNKKSKGAAARMDSNMSTFNAMYKERTTVLDRASTLLDKQQEKLGDQCNTPGVTILIKT